MSANSPDAVRRIDHVAVAAHDADRAARWYEESLGLRRVHDEVVEDAGVRLVWLAAEEDLTGAGFQIVQPLRPGPVADHLAAKGEGLHHVCFAVDNAAEFLRTRGESADQVFTGGYGLPCAFLETAPPGVVVEIVEQD
ncbi:VOC family protein [Glycomyces harbinensis]|uniref:Methylmalonyl-CoA/ethylmalonyl-CoA epimerase n=1 Tax=Glycomyces harbinensis TaxID=58114 RepID=A0A1G7AR19_9ACTN|nr:VOC family protein [Glycomyces harbinensis]SDE17140.1 methylmalonyl-CoA/ethylmalonyl-CoA epimerase [Glycomyces harbinensis]